LNTKLSKESLKEDSPVKSETSPEILPKVDTNQDGNVPQFLTGIEEEAKVIENDP